MDETLLAFHGRALRAAFTFTAWLHWSITLGTALGRALAFKLPSAFRWPLAAITHLRAGGETFAVAGTGLSWWTETIARGIALWAEAVTAFHGRALSIAGSDLGTLPVAWTALWGETIPAHLGARSAFTITGTARRLADAIAFSRSATGRAVTFATHLRLRRAALALGGKAVAFRARTTGGIAAHVGTRTGFALTRNMAEIAVAIRAGGALSGLLPAHIGAFATGLIGLAFALGGRAVTLFRAGFFAGRAFGISRLRRGGPTGEEGGGEAVDQSVAFHNRLFIHRCRVAGQQVHECYEGGGGKVRKIFNSPKAIRVMAQS